MSIRTLRMPTRSIHVIERNMVLFPHFWKVLAAGFVEPVFYLLGIGFGIGSLIRTIDMGSGKNQISAGSGNNTITVRGSTAMVTSATAQKSR